MTIVLNEKAKDDVIQPFAFMDWPIVKYVAQHPHINGKMKGHILMNLGIVYHDAMKEGHEYLVEMLRTGTCLNSALSWRNTPQGRNFWHKLDDMLKAN